MNMKLQEKIVKAGEDKNEFLEQVISNCDNPPQTDAEMEQMIKLPSK